MPYIVPPVRVQPDGLVVAAVIQPMDEAAVLAVSQASATLVIVDVPL
jgi:hypothetical protein